MIKNLIVLFFLCSLVHGNDEFKKFSRGDIDDDGSWTVTDLILFSQKGQEVGGEDWANSQWTAGWDQPMDRYDFDDDGDVDGDDFTGLMALVYGTGSLPPLPRGVRCYDPTPDWVDYLSDYDGVNPGVNTWQVNPYVYKQKYYGSVTGFPANDGNWDAGALDYGFFNSRSSTINGYGQLRLCQKFEHRTMITVQSPTGTGITEADWNREILSKDDFIMRFNLDLQIRLLASGSMFPEPGSCSSGNSPQAVNELRIDTSQAKVVFWVERFDGIEKGVSMNFDELRSIGPLSNGAVKLKFRQKFVSGGAGAPPPWYVGPGCYFVDLDEVAAGSGAGSIECGVGGIQKLWPFDFDGTEWKRVSISIPSSQFEQALGLAGVGNLQDWYLKKIRLYGVNFIYHKYADEATSVDDNQRGDQYDDLACYILAEVKYRLPNFVEGWHFLRNCQPSD